MDLGNSEERVALLKRANLKNLIPAGDRDWNHVRGLGLDLDFIQTQADT